MQFLIPAFLAAITASPALAHTGVDHVHSLGAGLAHPLLGLDHIAAMVLVGVWAALIGGTRQWLWPAAFVTAMVLGGLAGASGIALPRIETAITLSVVVLGLAVAGAMALPTALGAALIALFGAAHGYAHGAEAAGSQFLPYALGFVVATALLHAAGLFGGRLIGSVPSRIAGGAAAIAGLAMVLA